MRLLLLSVLASAALAQTPSSSIVLKAARMFDGNSAELASPGLVVIAGNKIIGVGRGASIPNGARIIDLGNSTLLPGFIDAHTHLSFEYKQDWKQEELNQLKKSVPELTLDAVTNLRTLMAGFTTVRDVGSDHFMDVGLRNAMREGKIDGPRMLVSVHALGATGGHCDDDRLSL